MTLTLAASAMQAHAAPIKLVEGVDYRTLATPEPVSTGKNIEVLEVFSYGCSHCYDFEPALSTWKQSMPADVKMAYMPATFSSSFALHARGFYAANILGVVKKTHSQVFDAVWKNGVEVKDMEQLANLYASLGVDRAKFMEAAKSIAVDAAVSAATEKSKRLSLEGTPSLYVDGKYEVLKTGARNYDDVMQRLDALIAKARFERPPAR